VGLLLEVPPRADWDSLGGASIVVADKFATNASNGGGGVGISDVVIYVFLVISILENVGINSIPKFS
jgi:hypothetical protein